ncbi:hypothetical protein [Deinococcus aluminii]|uniref:Uncharacterized protein n=1 Tax=Deinococcus aluminii TaxID=1656885 RepID=A0ABP9XFV3_9DEIO
MTVRQLPAGHEDLTRLVRKWGDTNTIGQYLDLMGFILEALELPNGDPRLVTSTPRTNGRYSLPLTVGMRYILAFHKSRESAFLILPRNYERGHVLFESTGHFDALTGERDVPPALGLARNLQALQENEQVLRDWAKAARAEISRQSQSTFRRHHKPAVYEAARDTTYRDVVFYQAFNDLEDL